jgi:hypothetical protein
MNVWVGLDVGKGEHFVEVLDDAGGVALCSPGG